MAYRRIFTRFWTDEKVRTLSLEEKAVALYCLSGPQTNRIGIYAFSPGAAAEHCETLPQTFAKRFQNVVETLNWAFDEASRVLYIPTWWKWNPPDNPNTLIGALKDLVDVPQSQLLQDFRENLVHLGETLGVTFTQTLAERYPIRWRPEQEQNSNSTVTEQEETSMSSSPDGEPDRAVSLTAQIDAVIAHYRTHHPKARPGTKERNKIRDRLKEGHAVKDLCAAIDGCHRSPHHCGDNDRGAVYQSLELIVRDASHVQQFLEIPSDPNRTRPASGRIHR